MTTLPILSYFLSYITNLYARIFICPQYQVKNTFTLAFTFQIKDQTANRHGSHILSYTSDKPRFTCFNILAWNIPHGWLLPTFTFTFLVSAEFLLHCTVNPLTYIPPCNDIFKENEISRQNIFTLYLHKPKAV